MAWFLYLLECRDGSLYTGIAVDVAARYAAHASGRGARYTRSHPPRQVLLTLPYPDRSSASKAEYALKQLSAAQKRAYAVAHSMGVARSDGTAQSGIPQEAIAGARPRKFPGPRRRVGSTRRFRRRGLR